MASVMPVATMKPNTASASKSERNSVMTSPLVLKNSSFFEYVHRPHRGFFRWGSNERAIVHVGSGVAYLCGLIAESGAKA